MWIPGYQRFMRSFTSDRIANALCSQIMIGQRSPGLDLFYQDPGDIFSAQIMMRSQIPDIPQVSIGQNKGLQRLGE
jgi:hypothetical protein